MEKKKIQQLIVILVSLLLCAIFILGAAISLFSSNAGANVLNAFAAEDSNDNGVSYLSDSQSGSKTGVMYLSDLQYHSANMEAGRPVIKDAVDANGTKIQIKIEGSWYEFDKGLFTHTSSKAANVTVVYNLENLDYTYFTAYVGLNRTATKGDGARFNVGTSVDGKNWTWMEQSPKAIGPQAEAKFLTVNISGAKWLQLWVNRCTGNAHDHAVWADAKLTNSLDDGEDVKPIQSFDAQIKALGVNVNLSNPTVELLVLQREFVSRVGQYALKKFIGESEDNKTVLDWLFNDLDSLREFILGGTPFGGSYYNSLTVLAKLYRNYKTDLDDTRLLKNKWFPDRTYGQLYRTMMFSVALTHDKTIGSYLQASRVENQSDPLRRYAIFRYMYETERFVATRDANGNWTSETMNLFGSLRVEEMRWLMSNIIDDESILWLNDYVQTRINASGKVGNLYTPHSYVKYVDPNYNNPVFYAEENIEYFNNLFAVDDRENPGQKIGLWDTKYVIPGGIDNPTYTIKITQGTPTNKVQKVWMNFKNKFGTGSVCGGISKSGTNIRTSRGIPAHVIGQPGHAAILYYNKNAEGKGSWAIDNNVGGWVAATKNERHLLGWGNAAWQRNSGGGGTVVFFLIAQEALNDYDNFVKAEEYTFLANVFQGDLDEQETLYEKALAAQSINLDAWYGLVQTYKAKSTKTSQDFSNLAKRIADTLYKHPLPLHCLYNLFKTDDSNPQPCDDALKNPLFTSQLKTLELTALTKAKSSGSSAAKEKANFILGATDTSVADFSFDGENAGCIVWADSFDGSGFSWKYSLDGKQTWSEEVIFTGDEPHIYQLSSDELNTISDEKDIYVYILGASAENAYKIDVSAKPTLPNTLYANDWENRVIGVDGTYEWRYLQANGDDYTPTTGWVSYSEASPNCSGDKIIEVRLKGIGKKPASEGKVFTFTTDNDTADRKYISVNYLSIVGYSTQSKDTKRPNYAVNAIDGNAKTYWHTDYGESIKETENTPYLIIKLDVPRYISGLEFVQNQYNASFSIFAKNVKVYVSEDGENWKEAGKRENFENVDDLKVVYFAESVYGQYVKLVLEDLYETNKNDGVFTTVSMVNLYEDTTKTESPAGEVMPSLSEVTPSGNAFAGLGEIINEEQAEILGKYDTPGENGTPNENGKPGGNETSGGNETPGETESPDKSNAGLWIALSVVGVVLVAAAVVFVLSKLGIIKIKRNENTDKGSKPETNTTKSEVSAAKAKASTAESTAKVTKPKTNAAESKVNATKDKTNTAESKSNAAKTKNK